MTNSYNRFVAAFGTVLIVLSGLPCSSQAQEMPAPTEPAAQVEAPEPEHLAPPLLDQMVAPIALYPDALLSQILMASTYPLEVIEAYRWANEPGNAALKGPDLEAALEARDWDPSVKSLAPFPDILKVMNDKLAWMQQLGNAFLSHPEDVMDAVQRLRSQAAAAGNLKANEQQRVVTEQQTIIIQQARPEVVYVPVYDPLVIYGPWRWPAYPPVYFAPFPRYGLQIGMFSWFSFGVVNLYWGWNNFDWHRHHIHIDRDRYHRIRRHGDPYPRDHWEHDPYHRRGVAYVDPRLRTRFRPNPAGAPATRVDHRGYTPSTPARPPRVGTSDAPPVRSTAPDRLQPRVRAEKPKPGSSTPDQASQGTDRVPPAAPTGDSDKRGAGATRPDVKPRDATPRVPPTPRARDTKPRVPPAFEDYSSGESVRAAVTRGRDSRKSTPTRAINTERPAREKPDARRERPR